MLELGFTQVDLASTVAEKFEKEVVASCGQVAAAMAYLDGFDAPFGETVLVLHQTNEKACLLRNGFLGEASVREVPQECSLQLLRGQQKLHPRSMPLHTP